MDISSSLKIQTIDIGPQLPKEKPTAVSEQDQIKVRELSEQFESVFLNLVLKSMRDTVHKGEMTDGGVGEEVFRSMLDSKYAEEMSKQRMTGIAATIEKDLLKLMEVQAQSIDRADVIKSYAAQDLHKNKNGAILEDKK